MYFIVDLGGIPDWISALAALLAIIFAWVGYKQLIDGSKDVQKQITAANKTAESMASLAMSWNNGQEASRKLMMPWFEYSRSEFKDNNELFVVLFKNIGQSPALNVKSRSEQSLQFTGPQNLRVGVQEDVRLTWKISYNNLDINLPLKAIVAFSDSYGVRYNQELEFRKDFNGEKTQPYTVEENM